MRPSGVIVPLASLGVGAPIDGGVVSETKYTNSTHTSPSTPVRSNEAVLVVALKLEAIGAPAKLDTRTSPTRCPAGSVDARTVRLDVSSISRA